MWTGHRRTRILCGARSIYPGSPDGALGDLDVASPTLVLRVGPHPETPVARPGGVGGLAGDLWPRQHLRRGRAADLARKCAGRAVATHARRRRRGTDVDPDRP